MPNRTRKSPIIRLPKYRLHKPSGRAVIQFRPLFGNNPRYLEGDFNSDASRQHYERCCQEILAYKMGRKQPREMPTGRCKVVHLLQHYLPWAKSYYKSNNGRGEYTNLVAAARPLRKEHGHTPLDQFGPIALKDVRAAMVAMGWARKHVNAQVHRVRRMFRWGVENEMVSADVLAKLLAVGPLRKGKTKARETADVKPAPRSAIDAVLPHLSPTVRAMLELHWLTGMRSDELCRLRPCEINRSDKIWLYVQPEHKTEGIGKLKVVPIGPRGQKLLKPYLGCAATAFVFSPRIALAEQSAARRAKSKSKPRRGHKRSQRHVRDRYTTTSYYHALLHGFAALARMKGAIGYKPAKVSWRDWLATFGVEYFHPHQLRHSRATLTRERFGKEGVVAQLGNAAEAVDIYALPSLPLAKKIAHESG